MDGDGQVATALSERTKLDFAWRYTDLDAVHTGRSEGRVVWRDGSREPRPLDLAAVRGGAKREHRVREIQVRERAMGDSGAGSPDELHVVAGDEIRMREDGVGAQQAEVAQPSSVRPAETVEHEGVFPVAFRAVGLHVAGCLLREETRPSRRPSVHDGVKRGVITGHTSPSSLPGIARTYAIRSRVPSMAAAADVSR